MKTSESIKTIIPAIIAFHGEMGKIIKTAENPFFKNKYASLPDILTGISEPLKNAGLAIMQFPKTTASGNVLETVLLHVSGEWISEEYAMNPVKQDPQSMGSAITYARRYAIGAILSLNIDIDDDGNKGAKPPKSEPKLLPELLPSTQNWTNAVEYLKKDRATISEVKKKFIISAENEKLLTAKS